MKYRINFEQYKHSFSLPSCIVVDDLQQMNSDFLKIILLIFKNADKEYSVNLLSNLLNLSEQTVNEAISYWVQKGALTADETVATKPVVYHTEQSKIILKKESNDAELKFLLEHMQQLLDRPVTSTDLRNITYIYEYYRLPADVILMAIQHCVEKGKNSMKYIEKVCVSWYDQGVTTHLAAEEYLKSAGQYQQHVTKVKRIFGVTDRALLPAEEKLVATWLQEYQSDFSLIQLAYEKTVKNTGKAVFAYANKILQDWHQKGYRSIEQVNTKDVPIVRHNQKQQSSFDIHLLEQLTNQVPNIQD